MSLLTRLKHVEAAEAERAAAEMDSALAEFKIWTAANWTEAEQVLWTRHLLNLPAPDDFYRRLSMTRAEAEAIKAEYAPLTPAEVLALEVAWARVPPALEQALAAKA
jgi:hypothetical protein